MDKILKVSQQTLWQLAGKGITALSTLVILGTVARSFDSDTVGAYTLVLVFIGFLNLAIDFGLNAYVLPSIEKEQNFQKLVGFRILLGIILFILGLLIINLWLSAHAVFKSAAFIGLFGIFGYGSLMCATAIFQKKLRYDLSIIASSLGTLVYLGLAVLILQSWANLNYLMIANVFGWSLSALIAFFIIKRFVSSVTPIFDLAYVKKTLIGVWPITLTLLINIFYFRIDSFLLASFKSLADVGIYNIAYSVFSQALVIPTFIMNGFYPLMIEEYENRSKKFPVLLIKSSLILGVISLIGIIFTFLLSPFLIHLIGGGNFSDSVTTLRILALSFPAFFISSVLMWALITLKKNTEVLLIYTVGLIFNLILNWIFIPTYSYLAAAAVTGICEYLILTLQIIILYRELKR